MPAIVLRWSPTVHRKIEAIRDRLFRGIGTDEAIITEEGATVMHYRKPLRIDEINRMAPTEEVRARIGRP